jgi:hypothetical protein
MGIMILGALVVWAAKGEFHMMPMPGHGAKHEGHAGRDNTVAGEPGRSGAGEAEHGDHAGHDTP